MADVAVVVGATGSIGSELVGRLVARGLSVVAVARDPSSVAALSPNVVPCATDIGDDAAIAAISQSLDSLPGRLRLAIFAAGLPVRGSLDTVEPSALARGADIKLGGMIRLVRGVDARLQRGSRLVMFAGSLGFEPRATEAGPGTINAAVANMMRQYSLLLGPRGITTHTISPGPMDTPRLRRIVATVADESGRDVDEVWAEYESATSLRRLPTVSEVAWLTLTLLDDEADVLHGAVLTADAGGHRGIG
jgi:NAD(P)-dependent dehydrogenase (short-subunit alcohol dehydrogenase family)